MKLYTEEQVKHAIQMARASQNLFTTPFIYDKYEILEQLTPIELPSDEEIEGYIDSIPFYAHCITEYCEGIEDGIKWTLDKIQGGNK
jgi:hypothetical protein